MNRIFEIQQMFPIPDGTKVSPFLNPLDANQKNLPLATLSGMSIAAGEVDTRVESRIHIHPIVAQVTWVIGGQLTVKMKGKHDDAPYTIPLQQQQAVLTQPGTFFQLINSSESIAAQML